MNRIEVIKKELKNINNRIESLMDKADDIKAIRESKGYSRAILKCNDIEAKQLIKVYDEMDKLELKEDQLYLELKQLRSEEYSKEYIVAHNNFKEYKYRVDIIEATNKKTIYTNDIAEYKLIRDKNVTILEYIDYNNTIAHNCNMPFLKAIYSYNIDYKYTVESIINQYNYPNYKTIYKSSDGSTSFYEYGLDKNNNDIYIRFNDYISIHNDYGSSNYISISKDKNSNIYHIHRRGNINYKVTSLDKELQEMLYKQLKRLESNKSYKYNIQELKDILNIA